ncbi:hypothetical protein QAY89_gp17 [Xanthomonas phage Langgrundblatt1]|uniref:Uncharacterized protein n=1 Tax=Xanthomonas phage Langgrundblatt1 TaxID=2939128 RepID=A0A9E7E163_9CAUD|nr:hypothetical protein QAY89_gp17 [Xanthomonas phage Langgrundblatt1]URA06782.1 hypothetical protein Langgrundblatt1_BL10017 [Xanthomonas phage Langgrundblatt1]
MMLSRHWRSWLRVCPARSPVNACAGVFDRCCLRLAVRRFNTMIPTMQAMTYAAANMLMNMSVVIPFTRVIVRAVIVRFGLLELEALVAIVSFVHCFGDYVKPFRQTCNADFVAVKEVFGFANVAFVRVAVFGKAAVIARRNVNGINAFKFAPILQFKRYRHRVACHCRNPVALCGYRLRRPLQPVKRSKYDVQLPFRLSKEPNFNAWRIRVIVAAHHHRPMFVADNVVFAFIPCGQVCGQFFGRPTHVVI